MASSFDPEQAARDAATALLLFEVSRQEYHPVPSTSSVKSSGSFKMNHSEKRMDDGYDSVSTTKSTSNQSGTTKASIDSLTVLPTDYDFTISKKPQFDKWTEEEDANLHKAVAIYGESNWTSISQIVRTKDKLQCRQRWQKVIRPGIKKGKWCPEEDMELKRVVNYMHSIGVTNWRSISERMPNRTSKQCRERWNHHLSPGITKGGYSPEEDKKLAILLKLHGTKWSRIAKEMPGRTENSVRSRLQGLRNEYFSAKNKRSVDKLYSGDSPLQVMFDDDDDVSEKSDLPASSSSSSSSAAAAAIATAKQSSGLSSSINLNSLSSLRAPMKRSSQHLDDEDGEDDVEEEEEEEEEEENIADNDNSIKPASAMSRVTPIVPRLPIQTIMQSSHGNTMNTNGSKPALFTEARMGNKQRRIDPSLSSLEVNDVTPGLSSLSSLASSAVSVPATKVKSSNRHLMESMNQFNPASLYNANMLGPQYNMMNPSYYMNMMMMNPMANYSYLAANGYDAEAMANYPYYPPTDMTAAMQSPFYGLAGYLPYPPADHSMKR